MTDKIHPQSLIGCSLCILASNASRISNRISKYLPTGALSDNLVNTRQSSETGRGARRAPLTQCRGGTPGGSRQARLASPGDTADPSAF